MTQEGDHSEDDIVLVGEYALHLLDADSRLAFEKRLADEPALRQLLREWDEGLISLADDFEPVAPPARLKGAVEARLFETPAQQGRSSWFSGSWLFGRRGAALALVALLVIAVVFGPSLLNGPQGPTLVAEIAAEDRALVVEATLDVGAGEIGINRVAGAAAEGRTLELWLIAEGAPAPVSLGVLPATDLAVVTVPDNLRAALVGGTLAISDEPPGGSPTGAPTGAILAVGAIVSS
jgi:anti-sigma-K factor RskA